MQARTEVSNIVVPPTTGLEEAAIAEKFEEAVKLADQAVVRITQTLIPVSGALAAIEQVLHRLKAFVLDDACDATDPLAGESLPGLLALVKSVCSELQNSAGQARSELERAWVFADIVSTNLEKPLALRRTAAETWDRLCFVESTSGLALAAIVQADARIRAARSSRALEIACRIKADDLIRRLRSNGPAR